MVFVSKTQDEDPGEKEMSKHSLRVWQLENLKKREVVAIEMRKQRWQLHQHHRTLGRMRTKAI